MHTKSSQCCSTVLKNYTQKSDINNKILENFFPIFLMEQPPQLFKLIIIGDTNVGKTCILKKYVNDQFDENNSSTIGVEFLLKDVVIDSTSIKLQIWDTAGQEIFRSVTQTYYRSANGAIVVFDITNEDSFNHLSDWIKDFIDNTGVNNIIIVGNKSDLTNERKVQNEAGKDYAKTQNLQYFETSAKNGDNIEGAFEYIAKMIYQKQKRHNTPDLIKIEDNKNNKNDKRWC